MNPVEVIASEYEKFVLSAGYSLRDFSRYLGIEASTLSKILSGKRGIPKSHAAAFAQKFFEKPEERQLFVESVLRYKTEPREIVGEVAMSIDEHHSNDMFMIISQWEFFAILNVLKVKKFNHSVQFISNSLNISTRRVNQCLHILERNKLISMNNNEIKRTAKKLKTSNDITSRALKLAHLEELDLAKSKMDVDVDKKYYQSDTLRISKRDMKKCKKIIEKMYTDIDRVAEQSDQEEVYMLACQFFPLSNCELQSKKVRAYEH